MAAWREVLLSNMLQDQEGRGKEEKDGEELVRGRIRNRGGNPK